MRKIKDVFRLRLSSGLSIRQIRASTKISVGAHRARVIKPGLIGAVEELVERVAKSIRPGQAGPARLDSDRPS